GLPGATVPRGARRPAAPTPAVGRAAAHPGPAEEGAVPRSALETGCRGGLAMRIMFLSHMPRNPRDRDHHARIEAPLQRHAPPGTRVELCLPDDYPGSKASE